MSAGRNADFPRPTAGATECGPGLALGALAQALGGRILGDADVCVRAVALDSRRATSDGMFAALAGLRQRGLDHVHGALARGATSLLVADERELAEVPLWRAAGDAPGPRAIWVHPEARWALGRVAALVHGDPTADMDVVAITGTNGKTTVAHLTAQLLERAGPNPRRVGVLGTAGHRLAGPHGPVHVDASHTTPDAPELQRLFARHRAAGGDTLVMEASSHAIVQERLAGTRVAVAAFTNLTREHLDYHGTLTAYARAKARLFTALGPGGVAVVNVDDPAWAMMASAATARGARVVTTSARGRADLVAQGVQASPQGARLRLSGLGLAHAVELPLRGGHNVENALTAAAIARVLGADPDEVAAALATVTPAPGRLEPVGGGTLGFDVLVDYAHSPDALERVLSTLRADLTAVAARAGRAPARLIVVFGCGGDRDRGKRPVMGGIAARLADIAFVTSDNPRSERPQAIIDDVLEGFQDQGGRRIVEVDRRRAIARALDAARAGDIVLIAGKGHENTQTIGKDVLPFDDRVVALEHLSARAELPAHTLTPVSASEVSRA
ncbi:MAG: UDP-N-acetylmuramoyl-L-alanyl-D-glutamate--2,6-diaminopimelate ligase [Planctomycetota bacterium]